MNWWLLYLPSSARVTCLGRRSLPSPPPPDQLMSALKSDPTPRSQEEVTPCSPEHILIAVCLSVRCNSLLIVLSAFLRVSKYRLLLIHTVSQAPRTLPGRGWDSVNTCVVPSETMTLSLSLNDIQVASELLAGRSKSQSPQLLPIDVYRIFFSSAKWETALKYVLYKTGYIFLLYKILKLTLQSAVVCKV